MTFLLILILPLLVAIGSFVFLRGITWKEFLLQLGASALVAGISAAIIFYQNTTDTEVWNGRVTNKAQVRVSCSHSYECNCRNEESCSGSGKDRTCTSRRVCDTCYEHSNDWDWDVYTSNRETISIDRIDRQGSYEPPRWAAVKINEPTAVTHRYTSYIKGAPDTLFRHQGIKDKYAGSIPAYPGRVYDYYRLNRLVLVGVSVPNVGEWNEGLALVNSELGSKKQVNMIVVLTDQPQEWYYALEEAWVGGKKNDAILVVGVESGTLKPTWATVMAWTTSQDFEVKLRDSVMDLPSVTPEATLKALRTNVEGFYRRKPMADFEYLAGSITPTPMELALSVLIGVTLAVGLGWVFHLYDPFGDAKGTKNHRKAFGLARADQLSIWGARRKRP